MSKEYQDGKQPCGKVIPLNKVLYTPRRDPVHTSVRRDEWLDRWLQPQRQRGSYFHRRFVESETGPIFPNLNKQQDRYPIDFSRPTHPTRSLVPRKVSFEKQKKEEVQRPSPQAWAESWVTRSTDHEIFQDGWPLPQWSQDRMSGPILRDKDFDVWSEQCVNRLEMFKISKLEPGLIVFSVEEAIEDAKKYAERREAKWKAQNEKQHQRLKQVQQELQHKQDQHANLVQAIELMKQNGQDM
ncbi:hypothetical protein BGZ65_010664, partial [Modicella reniformis]